MIENINKIWNKLMKEHAYLYILLDWSVFETETHSTMAEQELRQHVKRQSASQSDWYGSVDLENPLPNNNDYKPLCFYISIYIQIYAF